MVGGPNSNTSWNLTTAGDHSKKNTGTPDAQRPRVINAGIQWRAGMFGFLIMDTFLNYSLIQVPRNKGDWHSEINGKKKKYNDCQLLLMWHWQYQFIIYMNIYIQVIEDRIWMLYSAPLLGHRNKHERSVGMVTNICFYIIFYVTPVPLLCGRWFIQSGTRWH